MELYYIEMSLQMRNWLKDHRKKVQEALVMEGYIYIYIAGGVRQEKTVDAKTE